MGVSRQHRKCWADFPNSAQADDEGGKYCNTTFDSVTCWPQTRAGSLAYRPCPVTEYTDHASNASRFCELSGEWTPTADYNTCLVVNGSTHNRKDTDEDDPALRILYDVGLSVSTLVLLVALAIFLYFRSLRCLRNIIHCHLIVSFILTNVTWVVTNNALGHVYHIPWICKAKVTIYQYLKSTNFYWMFVEGLYLFSMVVWAFSAGKIKHWHYVIVGWVVPLVFIVVWAVLKAVYEDELCWLPHPDVMLDYIIHVPVCIILMCNLVFLATIIWVLVTKLRASTSLEVRQYRKAVRATLVLFPLLGLNYLLVFYMPVDKDSDLFRGLSYFNAALHGAQGLAIAVYYCFLNGEVQTLLRKKLSSIQDSRGLLTRHTKSSFIASPARSSCPAFAMAACNGRQANGTQPREASTAFQSETSALYPDDDAAEKML